MTRTKRSVEMCEGSVFVNMLRFLIPIMLTSLIQKLYNAADSMVVGRFAGEAALAGVGVTGSVSSLILNLFMGGSVGVSIVLGHALGSKDKEHISRVVHTAFTMSVTFGAVLTVAGILLAEPLLTLMNVNEEIMPHAKIYMQLIYAGKIPALIYNFGAGMLRAKGDSKRPLYIVTVSGIMNVVLNLIFVVLFKMEAAGVGLATVISQLYTAIAVIRHFVKDEGETKLYIKRLRLHKKEFLEIMRVSIPAGIQSVLVSFANVLVQSSVNTFSTSVIAGNSAGTSVGQFYYSIVHSVYLATSPFVSRNFGAKKYDRIKKIIGSATVLSTLGGIIIFGITMLCGKNLIALYQPDNIEAINAGFARLLIVGCTYAFCGYMEIMSASMRGIGYSLASMMTSAIGMCAIRIIWIKTVFRATGSFESLLVCFPVSWLVTFAVGAVMFIFLFRHVKKKNTALQTL